MQFQSRINRRSYGRRNAGARDAELEMKSVPREGVKPERSSVGADPEDGNRQEEED